MLVRMYMPACHRLVRTICCTSGCIIDNKFTYKQLLITLSTICCWENYNQDFGVTRFVQRVNVSSDFKYPAWRNQLH